jgi:hypothetical protein
MLFALEPFWTPYAHIKHSVLTGQPAFDTVYGTSVYKYFAEHPEPAALFGVTAASFHAQGVAAIATAHDFTRYGTVVDVGGGTGSLLAAILTANPGVRGVLFEQADDIEMLVIAGGADRDEREYAALLAAGGFDVRQIVQSQTASPSSRPSQPPDRVATSRIPIIRMAA